MNINTYFLRDNVRGSSNNYYREIARYTDRVLEKINIIGRDPADEYFNYLSESNSGIDLDEKECLLEFLVLGILWRIYLPIAMGASKLILKSLFFLTELSQSNNNLKKVIDLLRGILATLLYSNKIRKTEIVLTGNNTLTYFKSLIDWLAATGEFEQEVIRLKRWYDFLALQSTEKRLTYLEKSFKLADWFKNSSEEVLGKYTENVERFIYKHGSEHYWSEDIIFCNRKRVEYHLNMVGAEILNQVFREDYLKAQRKLLMVPACMRINPTTCRAGKTPFGYRCSNCSSECNVNYLTKIGEESSFDVFIIPHESMLFSRNASSNILGKNIAIIGVACPLHLISGGWKSSGMDVPAQCVLLDYCGCKNHWDKDGIPTEINYRKLAEIMNIEPLNKMKVE